MEEMEDITYFCGQEVQCFIDGEECTVEDSATVFVDGVDIDGNLIGYYEECAYNLDDIYATNKVRVMKIYSGLWEVEK